MRRVLIQIGLTVAVYIVAIAVPPVWSQSLSDIVTWGFGGVKRAREWVSPDGRLNQQSLLDRQPSALDIWPTLSTPPTDHEIAEVTLHRQLWDDPCQERLSLSAMAGSGGEYRISNEINAACGHEPRGLLFCFDNPIPGGPANCRLWVRPTGVYVSDDGVTWKPL